MAKQKTKKNYEFKTGDGKFNFKVLKSVDGKAYSIGGFYPITMQTENGLTTLTRKQTEKWCVERAIENGWFPADGKVK